MTSPKTWFNPPICFFKMFCIKSGKCPLLYYSSFLCVLRFSVVFLLCRSCNTDLFFSQSIYEFWTAVYYCCLYLWFYQNVRIKNSNLKDIEVDLCKKHKISILYSKYHLSVVFFYYKRQLNTWHPTKSGILQEFERLQVTPILNILETVAAALNIWKCELIQVTVRSAINLLKVT